MTARSGDQPSSGEGIEEGRRAPIDGETTCSAAPRREPTTEPVAVMTALDDRPPTRLEQLPPVARWEWRLFDADGRAHLYLLDELTNLRLELLRPWCLLGPGYPLEHDRPSIGPRGLVPLRSHVCPSCAAHSWARLPHPRTPGGGFAGDLFEVVTRGRA
ncbi:hypothetical protein [Amycolatopsis stemonae]